MKYKKIGLIGNPNVGKSLLFNVLTKSDAKVGNWSGVTVERQVGSFNVEDTEVSVIDLPGCYACCSYTEEAALDEEEVMRLLLSETLDLFVNVIDGRYLQRHLYLTCQLLEMGVRMLVVVNMSDLLAKQNIVIDTDFLAKKLGCPVITISAKNNKGINDLKKNIIKDFSPAPVPPVPDVLSMGHHNLMNEILTIDASIGNIKANWFARRWLEGDTMIGLVFPQEKREFLDKLVTNIKSDLEESADLLLADQRYSRINEILQGVVGAHDGNNLSEKIDAWLLHKWLGLPIFFCIMYLVFALSLGVGGLLQNLLSGLLDSLVVKLPAQLLYLLFNKSVLAALIAHGVGVGISTIITLMPVVIIVGVCLVLLEESGYMARAAFLIDKLMLFLKLPGRAFIAMILGFGCNVPAISATRTLASFKDRAMTVMMVPFMSCTARLTVYTALTSLFYPRHGALVVLFLYLLGFVVGLVTAWVLRFAWGKSTSSAEIIDFPAYQLPLARSLYKQVFKRSKQFMVRALKVVVWVSLGLSVLNFGEMSVLLVYVGKGLAWVLQPIGMQVDQWQASLALLFGALAKEVVVGALNTLYAQESFSNLVFLHVDSFLDIWLDFKVSFSNIALFDYSSASSLSALAKDGLRNNMQNSLAYLSFILLYLPCVSTLVVIAKELSWHWSIGGLIWSSVLAYGVAALIYQLSILGSGASLFVIFGVLFGMFVFGLVIVKSVRYLEKL
jgi:ferrous iron transport protein B